MSESKRSPLRATVPLHVTLQPPGRIQPRHFVESQDLCWMDDGKGETSGEAKGSWHHKLHHPPKDNPALRQGQSTRALAPQEHLPSGLR